MLSTTTTSILTAVLATIAVNGWNWPDNAVNRTCALQPRVESCQGKSESESLDKSLEVDTCCSPVDGLVSHDLFLLHWAGLMSRFLLPNSGILYVYLLQSCYGPRA
jgi:hypothetical protein